MATAEEVCSGFDASKFQPMLVELVGITVHTMQFDPENSHTCSTGHWQAITHPKRPQESYQVSCRRQLILIATVVPCRRREDSNTVINEPQPQP